MASGAAACGQLQRHIVSHSAQAPMSDNSKNLKSIGLKATYPRLKILDLFQSSGSPGRAQQPIVWLPKLEQGHTY